MKTITIKNYNKLTKAEKAQYPKFIAYFDFNSKGFNEYDKRVFEKAMEENDLLSAMKRVEKAISEKGEFIYLAEIMEKTEHETDEGYPVYKSSIMTRVNFQYDEVQFTEWHLRDKEHSETDGDYYVWWETDNRNGKLEWYAPYDKFNKE